jgi:hypothetical protein
MDDSAAGGILIRIKMNVMALKTAQKRMSLRMKRGHPHTLGAREALIHSEM